MKKLIFFGLLLMGAFSMTQVAAQDFGIRAGLNLANISGDVSDNASLIGLQFGPVAEFGLGESLDLHVGALYSMKGAKDDALDVSVKTNYIDVPLLIHYDLGGFYLEGGPQISLLMSAKAEDLDVKDAYKSTDLGFLIGAGYDLGTIRVDVRYGLGLSNIADNVPDDFSVKNSVITLGVSYMFSGSGE